MKRTEIESRARHMLQDHGLLNMAVDPIRLANQLGVKVYNAKFGDTDVHGLLAIRGGTRAIYVNADDPPVRKRFTVAHELGHMELHFEGGDTEFIDNADNFRTTFDQDAPWSDTRRREWEANAFAAALLMPEELVRRRWEEIKDPEGMARWFQVSQLAMEIRLDGLGLVAA